MGPPAAFKLELPGLVPYLPPKRLFEMIFEQTLFDISNQPERAMPALWYHRGHPVGKFAIKL